MNTNHKDSNDVNVSTNLPNLYRALIDMIANGVGCGTMESSVDLMLDDARKAIANGEWLAAYRSIERAALYRFGCLSQDYAVIVAVLDGEDPRSAKPLPMLNFPHGIHDATGFRPFPKA